MGPLVRMCSDVERHPRRVPFDLNVLRERYTAEQRPYLGNPKREDLTLELWIEAIEEQRRKPPLPEVQIRVGKRILEKCPQAVGASMHIGLSRESDAPSPLCHTSADCLAEVNGADIPLHPVSVSRILLSRYDRRDLYERVWTVPSVKLAREFGIGDSALRNRLKRLCIPVPGPGYWQKKSANKPVEPRPPLPEVQVRRYSPEQVVRRWHQFATGPW